MAEQSLASNNPFRRKTTASSASPAAAPVSTVPTEAALPRSLLEKTDPAPAAPAQSPVPSHGSAGSSALSAAAASLFEQHLQAVQQQHPTGDEFRQKLQALPKSSEAPPSTTFLKSKPIKKVRVQSPPPSSSDSVDSDFEARYPANGPDVSTAAAGTYSSGSLFNGPAVDEPRYSEYSSESEESDGSTAGATEQLPGRGAVVADHSLTVLHRPPPNPFHKTPGDAEHAFNEPQAEAAAAAASALAPAPAAGRGTLDVNAFRRLLMTGQTGGAESTPPAATPFALQPDAGSLTDASSISKQSILEAAQPTQETPRTSHEISEADDDRSGLIQTLQSTPSQRQMLRKKPPPPSSRHGKLINPAKKEPSVESSAASAGSLEPSSSLHGTSSSHSRRPSSSSSDAYKPLPAPPSRQSAGEGADSNFDGEAIGTIPKVGVNSNTFDDAIPTPRPPTPSNASYSTTSTPPHPISNRAAEAVTSSPTAPVVSSQPKKPTPPPRRQPGHSRSDSRSSLQTGEHAVEPIAGSRRSSVESTRSISSSLKLTINAPAPPPPRRPNHGSRPSVSYISPLALSFGSIPSAGASPSPVSGADRSPAAYPAAYERPVLEIAASAPAAVATTFPSGTTPTKLAKPPPPPARSISVRKKERRLGEGAVAGAGSSIMRSPSDSSSRRVGHYSHQQPPPPPPRARGSSGGSMEAPSASGGTAGPQVTPRKATSDGVHRPGSRTVSAESSTLVEDSSASAILADLDALQREVDALRKQAGM